MSRLAIHGGEPEVKGLLKRFNRIGEPEKGNVLGAMQWVLSGYAAGSPYTGYYVKRLEEMWADKMGVKFAIACNSATSGLMAAASAVNMRGFHHFLCPAFTMSATAAAPMRLGGIPVFIDSDPYTYNMSSVNLPVDQAYVTTVFLTHLFGYAVDEAWWHRWCKKNGYALVVDAAQAPFAKEDGRYAGTIGDVGVFSLNVHKHIQCGEGGIVVTNDEDIADRVRLFINHGECAGDPYTGLNLRMPELCAAVALAQLGRVEEIIFERQRIAEALSTAVDGLPGICAPAVDSNCQHVYYCWAPTVYGSRLKVVAALNAEGVPVRAGYQDPLYRFKAFEGYARPCPVAERLHDQQLILYENCAWDPTPEQLTQIGNAFAKVMEAVHGEVVGRDGPDQGQEAAAQRSG